MSGVMRFRGSTAETFHAWPWWCVLFRSAGADSERFHVETARARRKGIKQMRREMSAACLHVDVMDGFCVVCGSVVGAVIGEAW